MSQTEEVAFIYISDDRKLNAYNKVCYFLLGNGDNCLPGYYSILGNERSIYEIPKSKLEAALKIKGVTQAEWTDNYRPARKRETA